MRRVRTIRAARAGDLSEFINIIKEPHYGISYEEAASEGKLNIIMYLYRLTGNVIWDNKRPIELAAEKGHLNVVQFLYHIGDDGRCAMYAAALHGQNEVVKLLVLLGVSMITPTNIIYDMAFQCEDVGYLVEIAPNSSILDDAIDKAQLFGDPDLEDDLKRLVSPNN